MKDNSRRKTSGKKSAKTRSKLPPKSAEQSSAKGKGKGITETERNEMFSYWFENDCNLSETARKFKRAMSTMQAIRARDKWDKRCDWVRAKVREGIDRKIANRAISNVEIGRAIIAAELRAYVQGEKATGDPNVILKYLEYVDKLGGPPPEEPKENGSLGEELSELTAALRRLSSDNLKTIADQVATAPASGG